MAARKIFVVGSANIDLVVKVERLPMAGETVFGGDLEIYPGGKGANQACAAALMGGLVRMVAQVGKDPFGDRLIESLCRAGADVGGVGRSEKPTGSALIYVLPDGQNAIVVSPGANSTLEPEVTLTRMEEIGIGDFLLCQLEVPSDTVEASLGLAKRAGATTVLDPAPARKPTAELLALVDLLTPNQTEAAALRGEPELSIDSWATTSEVAGKLAGLGCGGVVLKLGTIGCYVKTQDWEGAVPAFAVRAVDSTAAGNVFNGALAVALSERQPVWEAALWASAAAAISVTRPGAQSSISRRGEVENFLLDHGIRVRGGNG